MSRKATLLRAHYRHVWTLIASHKLAIYCRPTQSMIHIEDMAVSTISKIDEDDRLNRQFQLGLQAIQIQGLSILSYLLQGYTELN